MLVYDVKKAHRIILVLRSEWGRQACQVRGSAASTKQLKKTRRLEDACSSSSSAPGPAKILLEDFSEEELKEDVFLNCVGTFGVTSAGY